MGVAGSLPFSRTKPETEVENAQRLVSAVRERLQVLARGCGFVESDRIIRNAVEVAIAGDWKSRIDLREPGNYRWADPGLGCGWGEGALGAAGNVFPAIPLTSKFSV